MALPGPEALGIAVFVTATLSGTFGMAGGLALMGFLALALPVEQAMVIHGLAQLTSNGSRALLLARHVRWSVLAPHAAGAAVAFAVVATLAWTPSRGTVLVLLGALPLTLAALAPGRWPTMDRAPVAAGCGLLVTGAQLAAGASGPLLDAFFVQSRLDRLQVVGTKALTQALGHALKLAHYGALAAALPGGSHLEPGLLAVVVAAAVGGTTVGRLLLARLSEERFRRWSRRLVVALSAACLARGVWELAGRL